MNVTADIQIECIAEPQFKEICELDGVTQSQVIDEVNVNRHKD